MFFEDHLVESSDSEPGAPISASMARDADGLMESAAPGGSQYPFHGRASSTSSAAATAVGGATSDIQLLIEATENERHCPDILPYPTAIVESVVAHVAQRHVRISELSAQEKLAAATKAVSLLPFKPSDIMALELQRILFFLCELLRCRLKKIETLCTTIYYEGQRELHEQRRQEGGGDGNEETEFPPIRTPQRVGLSGNERIVADRLATARHRAVLQAGLQSAPSPLHHLVPHPPHGEGLEILPEPELSTYVFGVALEDLGVVQVGEFAEQTINAGEIFLMPYRTFRPYVIAGRVRLL